MFVSEREAHEENMSSFEVFIMRFYKIRERNTSIKSEIKMGFIHFSSTCFILAVNGEILGSIYDSKEVVNATAIVTGLTCIVCGTISNLPVVPSPSTSVSLYYAYYLEAHDISIGDGNLAVLIAGSFMVLSCIPLIGRIVTHIVPFVLKV